MDITWHSRMFTFKVFSFLAGEVFLFIYLFKFFLGNILNFISNFILFSVLSTLHKFSDTPNP